MAMASLSCLSSCAMLFGADGSVEVTQSSQEELELLLNDVPLEAGAQGDPASGAHRLALASISRQLRRALEDAGPSKDARGKAYDSSSSTSSHDTMLEALARQRRGPDTRWSVAL